MRRRRGQPKAVEKIFVRNPGLMSGSSERRRPAYTFLLIVEILVNLSDHESGKISNFEFREVHQTLEDEKN